MSEQNNYTSAFQGKVIAAMMTDKAFLQKIYPILDYTLFELDALQDLVKWIKSYYESYKDTPDQEYILRKIDSIDEGQKSRKYSIEEWYRKIHDVYIPANGLDYIKDESFKFFNDQNWKKTIMHCAELISMGKFDEVPQHIKAAYNVAHQTDIGIDYTHSVDQRYNEDARVTLSTGYTELDEILKGGFGNGDLVTVMAPSGTGKSWMLSNFGANILKQGKNIIHYTLEMTDVQTAKRYDTILMKTPLPILARDPEQVKQYFSDNKDTLGVAEMVFWPMKTVTVAQIKAHAESIKLDKFKPDAIIIDYGDLIKPSSTHKDKRQNVEDIFDDLKQMAQELDIPVITASQTNRCHWVEDEVDTPHGKVKIGTLREGDEVLTHKGYRKVTHVFPIEKQPVYRIKLKSGKVINVSANHDIPMLYGKIKSIATGLEVGDKLFVKK